MQPDGSRTKKLVVAFHFEYSNPAAWKCDTCRNSGLDLKRRCAWRPKAEVGPPRVVWAHGRVTCDVCPVSYVTAESRSLLEEFHLWKVFGCADVYQLPARLVETIVILEKEFRTEMNHG